jgi:hypothetical protein
MRIATCSDEKSELTDALFEELEKRGHEVVAYGPATSAVPLSRYVSAWIPPASLRSAGRSTYE